MSENKRLAIEVAKAFIQRDDVKPIMVNGDVRFLIGNDEQNLYDLTDIVHTFSIDLGRYDSL